MFTVNTRLLPTPLNSGFKMDDYWIWCGSVVEDPDGKGFHMFAARWPKRYPMFEGYVYLSEIVRAWSPTMEGPYEFVKKIMPSGDSKQWCGRMVHNPTVLKYNDKYLLYFIGSTYNQATPSPHELQRNIELQSNIYNHIKIGLALADSPFGPWETIDEPILQARQGRWDGNVVTNPAACVHPDGRIFLYYRSNTPDGLRIGLAVAESPEGPYERIRDEPVMEGINIEDPFVWHNGHCFEMIAKDMTGEITGEYHSGAHFLSDDGINWHPSKHPQAYSKKITYSNGTSVKLGCLERPQLLLNERGIPKCMFAAASDGTGGFQNAQNTWNIAIPLSDS